MCGAYIPRVRLGVFSLPIMGETHHTMAPEYMLTQYCLAEMGHFRKVEIKFFIYDRKKDPNSDRNLPFCFEQNCAFCSYCFVKKNPAL